MGKRSKDLVGSTYFDQSYFSNGSKYSMNVILSTTLALYDYFENFLFNVKNDPQKSSRIVFAKNEYAFRARLQNLNKEEANSELQINTLNMPFMNFGISSISLSDQRLLASNQLAKYGMYIEELGKKVRLYPVLMQYEGCFFTTQASDAQLVLAKLYKQAATETLLNPVLVYNNVELGNYANLSYSDITYDGQYAESDWLEQNRIHTVAFSFDVDTYFVDTDPGIDNDDKGGSGNLDYAIVRDLYFKFSTRHNLNNWPKDKDDFDMMFHAAVDHVNQSVNWDFENKTI